MRSSLLALLLVIASASPALCWWHYAEWGMSASQLASASGGRTAPCQPTLAVCTAPPGGIAPQLYVDGIIMVGMPAQAAFAFDGNDRLVQTVVLFPTGDVGLVSSLLSGIHGAPVAGSSPQVWNDDRRGSTLTAYPVGQGSMLFYRPRAPR